MFRGEMLALRFTSASNGGIPSSHLRELLTPYGGEWGGWRELQVSELQFQFLDVLDVLEVQGDHANSRPHSY